MILRKEIEILGSKGRERVVALFDSGSTYSIISRDTAERVEIFTPLPQPKKLKIADGNYIEITHAIRIDFKINGITLSDEFLVFDKLPDDVIIGAKTMQAWRIKLDFEKEEVIIDPDVAKLILYACQIQVILPCT